MIANYFAKLARAAAPRTKRNCAGSLGRVPSTKTLRGIEWLNKLHTEPSKAAREARRILTTAGSVGRAMRYLNELLETYGVEAIRDRNGHAVAEYLNTGETYTTTILYDHTTRSFRVTTMGDWVEGYERKHARLP
jgi:hypothetical protein